MKQKNISSDDIDSPIKSKRKPKRRQIIESDDDCDDIDEAKEDKTPEKKAPDDEEKIKNEIEISEDDKSVDKTPQKEVVL